MAFALFRNSNSSSQLQHLRNFHPSALPFLSSLVDIFCYLRYIYCCSPANYHKSLPLSRWPSFIFSKCLSSTNPPLKQGNQLAGELAMLRDKLTLLSSANLVASSTHKPSCTTMLKVLSSAISSRILISSLLSCRGMRSSWLSTCARITTLLCQLARVSNAQQHLTTLLKLTLLLPNLSSRRPLRQSCPIHAPPTISDQVPRFHKPSTISNQVSRMAILLSHLPRK